MSDRTRARGAGEGDRRVGRRTLLIGGLATAVGAAALGRDELGRLWWRVPGVEKPRVEGAVDFSGARWTAASEANYRRADRPDDHPVELVIVHVTQGSYDSAVRVFKNPDHQAAT
ncbi:N-acetylmuramoyl-L-alanine amidase, partial [Streptomyces sp. UH6]|nr:N-acetylmuramoyl-L-alanine amidase [Streptomyces sp. UH6]